MTNLLQIANMPRAPAITWRSVAASVSRLHWTIFLSVLVITTVIFYDIHTYSFTELTRVLNNSGYSNPINYVLPEVHDTTTSTLPSFEITRAPDIIVDMDDRVPSYRLATRDGVKPYVSGNVAQAKLLEDLLLYETCQKNPSTTVVDVGSYLGDFGLYAAACGCTVYMFEIQGEMINLIRSSVGHNYFSTTRVFVHQNAVSDLPADSTVQFMTEGLSTHTNTGFETVRSVRLDDVLATVPSIYLLKVDVEGTELNVLRSAKTLFAERRIQHLICKYTAWFTDRAAQESLMPLIRRDLRAKFIYTLDRNTNAIYGPLIAKDLNSFHEHHLNTRVQTDIYAVFDRRATRSSVKSQRYTPNMSS